MRLFVCFSLTLIMTISFGCDVSSEAQLNADRQKYDFLIPVYPSAEIALPDLGSASDIGTQSELLMAWRTQAYYWGYAFEAFGLELVAREMDTPLLVDLDAERIVWGPYREGLIDEWSLVSPLEDYNPDWSLGAQGQPFERAYGRLGAIRLELLAEGVPWIQLAIRGERSLRSLAFWDQNEMLAQDAFKPDENAPLSFDSMVAVYTFEEEQEYVSDAWIGLVNVVIPALNLQVPQLGALWGTRQINDDLFRYLVYAGVIDADQDGIAAEQAEIRVGYRIDSGRIVAGRAEAFAPTPADTAIEGWAIIECLGAGGAVSESYRVPVQRGAGSSESALGAFTNQCPEGFRSGLSTLNVPTLSDIPQEVLWLQSLAQ